MTQQLSRHGIGASEIAAICGLNPYAGPWDVYLRKIGEAPDEDTPATEWGRRLEPAIRQAYADQTGAQIYVPPCSLFHPELTWARATPDGIVLGDHTPVTTVEQPLAWSRLVQCKNVGYWAGKEWEDAPPAYVQLQEQWELYVTGLQRADVAALVAGSDFRVYAIHRDERAIADMLTIAEEFWHRVESRTPPKVDGSDACRRHFERSLRADAIEVIADADTEALFAEWRSLVIGERATKKRIEEIRNRVREIMATAGASVVRSSIGDAKLSRPRETQPTAVINWKYVAELLGSTKCTPEEFAALVEGATSTLTPEPKAPTLLAPRNWSKET